MNCTTFICYSAAPFIRKLIFKKYLQCVCIFAQVKLFSFPLMLQQLSAQFFQWREFSVRPGVVEDVLFLRLSFLWFGTLRRSSNIQDLHS